MTDTFTWRVTTESGGGGTLSVNKAQFGDGYSQTLPKGLNNDIQQWNVSVPGYESEVQPALDFIRAHEGRAFFWTPPLGVEGYYQCLNYTVVPNGGGHYSLKLDFIQSYAPLP